MRKCNEEYHDLIFRNNRAIDEISIAFSKKASKSKNGGGI